MPVVPVGDGVDSAASVEAAALPPLVSAEVESAGLAEDFALGFDVGGLDWVDRVLGVFVLVFVLGAPVLVELELGVPVRVVFGFGVFVLVGPGSVVPLWDALAVPPVDEVGTGVPGFVAPECGLDAPAFFSAVAQ